MPDVTSCSFPCFTATPRRTGRGLQGVRLRSYAVPFVRGARYLPGGTSPERQDKKKEKMKNLPLPPKQLDMTTDIPRGAQFCFCYLLLALAFCVFASYQGTIPHSCRQMCPCLSTGVQSVWHTVMHLCSMLRLSKEGDCSYCSFATRNCISCQEPTGSIRPVSDVLGF